MGEQLSTFDENMRRALFTPCETKEQLGKWIQTFLGLHFPDCTVAEESNSNPLEMIWEVYDKCRKNSDEDFSRVMAYASRGGYKTLGASALEVLQVLHLGRNVAHMAAVFDQSKKSQEYVRDFFAKPYIRDFRVGQNVKKIEICRYYNGRTGQSITDAEWSELAPSERMLFERKYNYIQIVLCTMQGANSAHTEFFCVDEVDVVPKQNRPAYEEAKHIPDPRAGLMPVTLLTSTRKFSYGLVQTEIDNAKESKLQVRHWNIIDITQSCAPERHRPEEPNRTYYVNDSELKHITEGDFQLLDEQTKKKWVPTEGFAGCEKCPLFAACKGRLATHQKSKSPLLKPIASVIQQFRTASLSAVLTQLLCRQPDESGLIYPKLDYNKHMKSADEIATMITGEPQSHVTKSQLLQLLLDKGARFFAGMDFGFTHNFSTVVGAVFGQFAFVFTVIAAPGLELDEKIAMCEPLKPFNPTIFGDPEAPADIKTFKRKGFNMREWDKYKGSVKAGIEVVRMKLMPAVGSPTLFFLRDDPGCELLFARLKKYHFMTDAAGQISEEPDDEDDDEADALRYFIMNVFAPKGKLHIPAPADVEDIRNTMKSIVQEHRTGKESDWMKEKISQLTGDSEPTMVKPKVIKRGKFVFDG